MGTRNSIAILLLFCSIAGAQFVWGPRKILPIPPPVTAYRFETTNSHGTYVSTIRQSDCIHPWDTNKDCWQNAVGLWTNTAGIIGRSYSNRITSTAPLSGWVSTNQVCWFSNNIFTITFWLKPNNGGRPYNMIREAEYPWTSGDDWAIDHDSIRMRFYYATNVSPVGVRTFFQLHVDHQPMTNAWNFVVAYYQPTQLGLALMNSMYPSVSFQVSNCSHTIPTNQPLMDFGNVHYTSVTNTLDELCIFDRLLSVNEVKWMYNNGHGAMGHHIMGYGLPGISITR